MRTFIAIPLPTESRVMLDKLQGTLRAAGADISWTDASSIHLTLKFLGEVDPGVIPRLADALRTAALTERTFTLLLQGLGGFPNLRNPRILWCGIQGDTARLASLQKKVEAVCADRDVPQEARHFRAHLTLGRVRSRTNLHRLLALIEAAAPFESTLPVEHFNIYKSVLNPHGAVHTIVERIELGK